VHTISQALFEHSWSAPHNRHPARSLSKDSKCSVQSCAEMFGGNRKGLRRKCQIRYSERVRRVWGALLSFLRFFPLKRRLACEASIHIANLSPLWQGGRKLFTYTTVVLTSKLFGNSGFQGGNED